MSLTFLLQENGDKLLLEDGGRIVLEGHHGINITGEQQRAQIEKRPVINLPVEFTLRIKAGIIPLKFFAEVIFERLNVISFNSKMLREAFILPINKMEFKLKNIRKRIEQDYELLTFENLLDMATENDLVKAIGELFKRHDRR